MESKEWGRGGREPGNNTIIRSASASFRCELHPTYRLYIHIHTCESSRKALCKVVGATRELKWKLYYRVDPHPYIIGLFKTLFSPNVLNEEYNSFSFLKKYFSRR